MKYFSESDETPIVHCRWTMRCGAVVCIMIAAVFAFVFVSFSSAAVLPVSQWTLQAATGNRGTANYDFLLLESILSDFVSFASKPLDPIFHFQPQDERPISKDNGFQEGSYIDESEAIPEAALVPETRTIIGALSKGSLRDYLLENQPFAAFLHSFAKIGMNNCSQRLVGVVDLAASTVAATTLCRINAATLANHTYCSPEWLALREWSLLMLDSWGRPPAGFHSTGPFFWLGAYDQCLSVDPQDAGFTARYCRADLLVSSHEAQRSVPLSYGMCLPWECAEENIRETLETLSRLFASSFGVFVDSESDLDCQHVHPIRYSISQWATVFLLALLLAMVVLGTALDLHIKHRRRNVSLRGSLERGQGNCRRYGGLFGGLSKVAPSRSNFTDLSRSVALTDAPSFALTYRSAPALRRAFRKRSFFVDLMRCFSVRLSVGRLLRSSSRQIGSLHGIRVFSAFWVVLGHAHLLSLEFVGNVRTLLTALKRCGLLTQLILNASLSVDSFLLISAAVLSFSFRTRILRPFDGPLRAFSISRWLIFYAHRFTRLLPAYVVTFLVVNNLFMSLGDGPMWSPTNGVFGARCTAADSFRHFLFITNFFPNECMPWMWYLSLDSQFYLVAPFIVVLLYKFTTYGVIALVLTALLSIAYRAAISLFYRFPGTITLAMLGSEDYSSKVVEDMFVLLYAVPYARISPFLIGVMLGWTLAKPSSRSHSKMCIFLVRIAAVSSLLISLFGAHYLTTQHSVFAVVYSSLFRTLWACGLALIVWLCERGYLSLIHSILSWNKWILLSRLSLGFYLVHEPLVIYFVWTNRGPLTPSSPSHFLIFAFGISLASLFAAFLIAIVIEGPPLIIERKLFKKVRQRGCASIEANECSRGSGSLVANPSRDSLASESPDSPDSLPSVPPMLRCRRWIVENHCAHKSPPNSTLSAPPLPAQRPLDAFECELADERETRSAVCACQPVTRVIDSVPLGLKPNEVCAPRVNISDSTQRDDSADGDEPVTCFSSHEEMTLSCEATQSSPQNDDSARSPKSKSMMTAFSSNELLLGESAQSSANDHLSSTDTANESNSPSPRRPFRVPAFLERAELMQRTKGVQSSSPTRCDSFSTVVKAKSENSSNESSV